MDSHAKSLFSRQIGAIGKNTMEKLMNTNVLLIGANSIALEFSKCTALLGINKLIIIEPLSTRKKTITKIDKSKYYHRKTSDLGDRSEHIADLAKKINPNIKCTIGNNGLFDYKVHSGINYDIIEKYLKLEDIHIVVYTAPLQQLCIHNLETVCINNGIKFILGFNHGLEGYVFNNFGKHIVNDIDGEITQMTYLENFEVNEDRIILTTEKLENTLISRVGVLMDNKQHKVDVKVLSSTLENIIVESNPELRDFLTNNKDNNIRFIESKDKLVINCKNYKNYISDPNTRIITLNSSFNFDQTHIDNKNKYLKRIDTAILDELVHKRLMYLNDFPILGCIIGGILAHEVIKVTGKYTPLDQDIYFDFRDLNPELYEAALDSAQTYVLDKKLRKVLSELNIFMIGCGALGCEISKNMGLLDISTKNKGLISITDMDTIELSNLNRQFLFRNDNIGQHKSSVVKQRLDEYFPKMKVKAFTNEVGANTENIFNSAFWKNNSLIINALDNVEARRYVDSKCVLYEKPLFESGTLGGKCNTQTIIPNVTATYSEIIDIDDKSIPMCTVRNFPNKIEHCVEWGIEVFDRIITQPLTDLNKIISNKKELIDEFDSLNDAIKSERGSMLLLYLELYKKKTFVSFLEFSQNIYNQVFKNPIKDILHSFPDDLTDEYGNNFWSGKKLKPTILSFNDIAKCSNFVLSLYNVLKDILNISKWNNTTFTNYITTDFVKLETIYKCKTIKVNEEKDEISIENINVSSEASLLLTKIKSFFFTKKMDIPILKYDKDDDILLEIMGSITNMRAKIYNITVVDILEIKMISGRIIPALSTTTTIISGFVVIELLKYLRNIKSSDININLGTNSYVLFDSQKPMISYNNMMSNIYGMKVKTVPENFNTWKRWRISVRKDDCITVGNLINILKNDYNIEPMSLNIDKLIIYNSSRKDVVKSLETLLCNIYEKIGKSISEHLDINICAFDEYGIPILTPSIVLSY